MSALLILFNCNLMIFAQASISHARPQAPIIGAQISILKPQTREERRYLFAQLRTSGFNTIIVRVFHNSSDRYHYIGKLSTTAPKEGVYFDTRLAPVISNLLPDICRDAHAEGLRVFAWMTTLHANYDHKLLPKVYNYNPQRQGCKPTDTLDPTAPENRKFLTALYRDLAKNPIDGIMFQDDLELRHTEGFHPRQDGKGFYPEPADLYNFTVNKNGITGYKPIFWKWSNNKAIALQNLSNAIMAACRQVNQNLIFARNIHYETLLNPQWGKAWFAEIPEVLSSSAADYFFIMAYQQQIRRELNINAETELEELMQRLFKAGNILEKGKQQVVFKLQAVDWKNENPLSSKKISRFLRLLKKSRRNSVVMMPYNENLFAHSIGAFSARQPTLSSNKDNNNLLTRGAESRYNFSNNFTAGIGANKWQAVHLAGPGFHQLTTDNILPPPVTTFNQDIRFKQSNEL